MRIPVFLQSTKHSLSVFLTVVILVGRKWHLVMVLIFISLMTNDVDNDFIFTYYNIVLMKMTEVVWWLIIII